MPVKKKEIIQLFQTANLSPEQTSVFEKVIAMKRISESDCMILYEEFDVGMLGVMANYVREAKHGKKTFFNRNFHIEPTNICLYDCTFCSYSRRSGEEGSWDFSIDEVIDQVRNHKDEATEVHVVGGVHPDHDLEYYCEMIRRIKAEKPEIAVKAFTAIELDYMIKKSGLELSVGLIKLKEAGLDSIPGGGAEIFDKQIREQLCDEKATADMWLTIHETAHSIGIPSNATILYGHIEKFKHRVDHLAQLRNMQDRTKMFSAFIPLKYRKLNNDLSNVGEVSVMEDWKNYAVSRIFLDNIDHIKAYWPMIGRDLAQLSLSFGVDDLDGTIDDSTRIYSMAGADDQNPSMSSADIVKLIHNAGRIPVERDTFYNELKVYDSHE